MVGWVKNVPKESIIEIKAKAVIPKDPITGPSQKEVELLVQEFWVISKSAPTLPFNLADASRLVLDQAAEGTGGGEDKKEENKDGDEKQVPVVKQDIRLNNRIIDLRVPTNQAIFKLQSGIGRLYREFMMKNGFTEIHTPKMIPGASEGGADVFKFDFFGQ